MGDGLMCGCGQGPQDSDADTASVVLLLGLEGSGKTLLAQRLRALDARSPTPVNVRTVETNGMQVFRLETPRGCPVKEVLLKEVGGSMRGEVWDRAVREPTTAAVLFALDVADAPALAAAAMELYELLQHPCLASKPLCLALTKADLPGALGAAELDVALGLGELQHQYPGRLRVTRLSALPPTAGGPGSAPAPAAPSSAPQLRQLADWLIAVRTAAAAAATAAAK